MNNKPFLLYVGTYVHDQSPSIFLCHFSLQNGELRLFDSAMGDANPSFLAIYPTGKYLYAVNELTGFHGQPGGGVSAFAIDGINGRLTLLNQQPSHGTHPCHLAVDRSGRYVLVANYTSGTVAVYPIKNDGKLDTASDIIQHHGHGPDAEHQSGPHAHMVDMDPANRFALCCDLGMDKVILCRLDPEKGKLAYHSEARLHPGAGPRHFDFCPQGRFVYVINELDATLTVFAYHTDKGSMDEVQTITTLPHDYSKIKSCAEIAVHPAGKFVYGSNRGHDSIVIYKADAATGRLALQGFTPTQGKTPRSFVIDPTGNYLLVANQDSNNIVTFRIDPPTGALQMVHKIDVPKPVCLKFWDLRQRI